MKSLSLCLSARRPAALFSLLAIFAAAGLGGCADQHRTTALRTSDRVYNSAPRYYDRTLGSYYYADNFGPYYGGFGPYYDDYDPFLDVGFGLGYGGFRHGGYYGGHHLYGGSFGRYGGGHFGGGHFGGGHFGGGHFGGGGGHHR